MPVNVRMHQNGDAEMVHKSASLNLSFKEVIDELL